jgi:hypothetical protein
VNETAIELDDQTLCPPEAVDFEESPGYRDIRIAMRWWDVGLSQHSGEPALELAASHAPGLLAVVENGTERCCSLPARIALQERVDGDAIGKSKHFGLVHRLL